MQIDGRKGGAILHLLRHLTGRNAATPDHVGPGAVVHNALVVLDVAFDDAFAQRSAIHVGIRQQRAQETSVRPSHRGFGLLRGDGVTSVGLKRCEDLGVGHETGVQTDEFELLDASCLLYFCQGSIQFGEIDVVAHGRGQGDVVGPAAAGGGVRPAAGPAHAMIRENERVFVGGIVLHRPLHKVD